MSYVRIVLTNFPVTRDEERQLFARTVEVIPALNRNNGDSTMVSIEHVSKPEDFLRDDKPRAVHVQLHILPEPISAEDRARITCGTIDMLRDVLGTTPDRTYQVDIEAPPFDSRVASGQDSAERSPLDHESPKSDTHQVGPYSFAKRQKGSVNGSKRSLELIE